VLSAYWVIFKQLMHAPAHATDGRRALSTWQPPPVGTYKINCDAACFVEGGCGLGAVIRDHMGNILMGAVHRLSTSFTPEISEAMAMRLGLQVALQAGLPKVIVESDCVNVVHASRHQPPPDTNL